MVTFKVKRSKVNLQGAGAYCGALPHSLFRPQRSRAARGSDITRRTVVARSNCSRMGVESKSKLKCASKSNRRLTGLDVGRLRGRGVFEGRRRRLGRFAVVNAADRVVVGRCVRDHLGVVRIRVVPRNVQLSAVVAGRRQSPGAVDRRQPHALEHELVQRSTHVCTDQPIDTIEILIDL